MRSPSALQAGCRGRSPRRGYSVSPCSGKRRRAGQVGQRRRPSRTLRRRRAQATTRPSAQVMPHPPCKIRTIVLWYPMKWANGLLLFLGACRIHEHWGLTTENPPVAEALREQPKGQDPPRKAGTGANAVVRHRLFGAIPLRDASATGTRPIRDASATGTRPIRDASATAARHNRDASVPAPPEIRLTILTTYNQRSNPPPYSGQVRLGANPFISACRNAENPPSTQLS